MRHASPHRSQRQAVRSPRRATARTQSAIESMEPRLLFTTVTVTNLGVASDSHGHTTSGWTGFLISAIADAGKVVTAVDMGQTSASTNGIFGAMLQDWTPDGGGGNTPTPTASSATAANGSTVGTDSHVLAQNRFDLAAPFEDSDNVQPAGAPTDNASNTWGTGSALRGVFGITAGHQVNGQLLAYVVLKDGTSGSYTLQIAEAVSGGQSSSTTLTGSFSAPSTTGPTVASGNTSLLQPAAGQTAQMAFTVSLDKPTTSTVTVDVSTADDTAIAGTDYDAVPTTTLTFAPGEVTKTVNVTIHGQSHTSPVDFFLNLSNVTGPATLSSTTQVKGTIQAEAPTTLSTADTSVLEPAVGVTDQAVFTLTLGAARQSPVTVDFTTADGTAVAGTDYDATSGTLTFNPGETSKTISVTVHGVVGTTADKTFTLNLSNPVGTTLDQTQVTGTISSIGNNIRTFDARHRLIYTDSQGRTVILALTGPGTGQAAFPSAAGDEDPTAVAASGTTAASSLVIRSIGGATTLPDVIVQGSLGVFGGTANLTGDVSISGGVRAIVLGNTSGGHAISFAQGAVPTVVRLGNASDLSITTPGSIAALTALSWADTDGTADVITASAINTMVVAGPSAVGLSLSGNLGVARVVGAVMGGGWTVGGNVRAIVGGSFAGGWSGAFTGNIGALVATGDFAGTLTAASVTAMRVGGDLSGTVTLTGSLGTLVVGGAMNGAHVRTTGNINVVSAGSVVDSVVGAGVPSTFGALPSDASALIAESKITTFAVRGQRGVTNAFSNSVIAALTIHQAVVRSVKTDNGGTPFGIATESLGLFADVETGKRPFIWRSTQDPALLTFTGDLKVNLLPT